MSFVEFPLLGGSLLWHYYGEYCGNKLVRQCRDLSLSYCAGTAKPPGGADTTKPPDGGKPDVKVEGQTGSGGGGGVIIPLVVVIVVLVVIVLIILLVVVVFIAKNRRK